MSYLEYMAGRYSGRYSAIHPSWFRKTPNKPWLTSYGNGDRSISSGRQQQGDLYYNPETVDRQWTLQGTQLGQGNSELDELARLLNKYAPDKALKALQWAKIRLQQGDRKYLNDMLQILRSLEPRGWRPI